MMQLTKSTFISGDQCHKKLYLEIHDPKSVSGPSASAQLRFKDGQAIDKVARERWPDGVTVGSPSSEHDQAEIETNALVQDITTSTIFQGAFSGLDVQIRTDVLERSSGDGWHLFEVKSSTKLKSEHITDVAIQVAVLESAGIEVTSANVVLVNNKYKRGSSGLDPSQLLFAQDLTIEVRTILPEVLDELSEQKKMLGSGSVPRIDPGSYCKKPFICGFWKSCTVGWPKNHISTIPRLAGKRLQGLVDLNVDDVKDIPSDYALTAQQEIIRRSVVSGSEWRSDDLDFLLDELQAPVYYLDFETVHPAVPLFQGNKPYEQVPIQWSCVTDFGNGKTTASEFLADGGDDPRRAFAESLAEELGNEGVIVVYDDFERLRLTDLKESLPDLEEVLDVLIGRLWDLQAVIAKNYYHPNFLGSRSIKAVLPALVAGDHYSDLEISDGDAASLEFTKLMEGAYSPEVALEKRNDLLAYCGLDALAMKLVVEALRT